ncbi:MAG: hypothetical protein K0Q95_2197 [Bacteroidota bacterium]|jgi:hypothetical protein|nr:hypothetical protein [Bacteroidota bacterium]
MKKDITPPEVKDIAVAVVQEQNDLAETIWNVYLINLKSNSIEGVLVSSMGYGSFNDEEVKTSTLRHFLDEVAAKDFKKIEPIMEAVFGLNNEFWVSFYENKVMYDKKYIFLPETIKEENFVLIPYLNKKGVMIK